MVRIGQLQAEELIRAKKLRASGLGLVDRATPSPYSRSLNLGCEVTSLLYPRGLDFGDKVTRLPYPRGLDVGDRVTRLPHPQGLDVGGRVTPLPYPLTPFPQDSGRGLGWSLEP